MPDDTKPTTTAVAPRAEKVMVHDEGLFHNLMDTSRFEHLQRVSNVFANSSLVPEHFRGKAADCFIAVEMAMRLKLHPFNLMQSLYVVHGKPGIEAKMAIALINSSGIFEAPLQWTLSGDGMKRQAIARAVHAKSKQVCEATVSMEMAKAEGWLDKSGSKWKTLPDLMLQYRSASFFARLYCPEVIFGMQTREELEDTEIDVTPVGGAGDREIPRQRPSLRDRVLPPIDATPTHPYAPAEPQKSTTANVEGGSHGAPEKSLAEMGITIDETPTPAAQAGAGGTPTPAAPQRPDFALGASTGGQEPLGMPFESVLKHAKRARTVGESEVVLDALRDGGYTDAQRDEVKIILNSKAYATEKYPLSTDPK